MSDAAMPSSVVLRNAAVPTALVANPVHLGGCARQDLQLGDLLLREGRVAGFLSGETPEGALIHDLAGQILLPRLAEGHCHLDKCHSIFRLDAVGGDLMAAAAAQRADRAGMTAEDIRRRAGRGLAELHAAGCALVRSHVDWDADHTPSGEVPPAWRVLGAIADDWSDRLILQRSALIALEQFDREGYCEAVARCLARDGGVLGVFVLDQARKIERLHRVFALAERYGLALDFHVDEGLYEGLDGLDSIAEVALDREFEGPILCGHACSLMNATGDALDRLLEKIVAAGLAVAALPSTNLYLQGRKASGTPERRGITRLRELRAAGVTLAVGSDNVGDAFCPLGSHDPMVNLGLAALVAHLDPPYGPWLTSVTTDARRALGVAEVFVENAEVGDLLCAEATHSAGIVAGARRTPLSDLLLEGGTA
jgi:cytosine deaminase